MFGGSADIGQLHQADCCTQHQAEMPVIAPDSKHTHPGSGCWNSMCAQLHGHQSHLQPCWRPAAAVVPPGYALSGGSMAPCDNGFFRDGWVLYSDPKAASCTPCGEGISSDAREADENPLAVNGSLVRVTSDSCCECGPWHGAATHCTYQPVLPVPLPFCKPPPAALAFECDAQG